MDFMTAVRTCFSKYVDFSGRARRSEYWWFALFTVIVGLVASILDTFLGTDIEDSGNGVVSLLSSLALLLPTLAVGARRLHDTGRSGWWQLLGLIPIIGWIIQIVWMVFDSEPGDNKYGKNPKSDTSPDYPAAPPGSGPYYGG
ncbi:DUF805 domain-containing protein [Nocardioides houyundeii]|uniref:DUF805 domain-containing protein n=1 Tax=Nocardioides houyundeii TaxID=2045452 RepID=UPI000DF2B0D4|nr:DUF805 domain-containing protein [Nocardioides houyundeii]